MIILSLTTEESLFLKALLDLWIEAEEITVEAITEDLSLDMTELQEAAYHVSEQARIATNLKSYIDTEIAGVGIQHG